jgi:dTDP-4-dehydrorhamnose 3,5-epimerase
MVLPVGVVVWPLVHHRDARGSLVEAFRASNNGLLLHQLNVVVSQPGALRGVHLHRAHADHLLMVEGRMVVGLYDCRADSPTAGCAAAVVLHDRDCTVTIPPGVAHGFWFPHGGTLLYGLSSEWSMSDELGCRWDDPDLGIDWCAHGDPHPRDTADGPLLSERDHHAGRLGEMLGAFAAADRSSAPRTHG